MLAGRFVLENEKGEVVRAFAVDSDDLYIIYRQDLRRVEIASEIESLKEQGLPFEVLRKTSASTVQSRAISLSNGARFKFVQNIQSTAHLVQVNDDDSGEEKKIYQYTALTQISVMLLILIIGLLIELLFYSKPQEAVVTVIPQQFVQPKEEITVKPAQHKPQEVKKVALKKIDPPKRPVSHLLTAHTRSPRKENAPVRTHIKIENMGALGALGGSLHGSKNSAGFNVNAINNSKASSYTGVGSGGVGGLERAGPGQGLVASAAGNGEKIEGGGGYGTRGKAGGGRPGYGNMNMGGTAAAYFEPVSEEALIEGGLSLGQIAAVIDRHKGEIIYCYEKGLQVKPQLNGRVGTHFVINGSGSVQTANIGGSSLGNAQIEGCILSHLRGWKFPHPVGGVLVKVSYPFVLKRLSHG